MEVIYLAGRSRARSITYSNPCTCRYMDIRDPSSNKLESPKWRRVLLWAVAVSSSQSARVIQIQGLPKRRRRKILLPAEQKRNHFGNYVDSPLCRERQLILCSKAGSQVKRGCGREFDQTVECVLASKGNIVCPPFLTWKNCWLGMAACLLSGKLELKICAIFFPATAVVCTRQQLLRQLQAGNEVMNGVQTIWKPSVKHNPARTKQ